MIPKSNEKLLESVDEPRGTVSLPEDFGSIFRRKNKRKILIRTIIALIGLQLGNASLLPMIRKNRDCINLLSK